MKLILVRDVNGAYMMTVPMHRAPMTRRSWPALTAAVCVLLLAGPATSVGAAQPTLGPGFILAPTGSLTSTASEVISGTYSIKGSYTGAGSYTPYLRTDPNVILLAPGRRYRITFLYKILTTPDKGFEVLFFSPTGGSRGSFLPSTTISGSAGSAGVGTLTNTLADFADYEARWNIVGKGAIVIDDIRITDEQTSALVVAEDAEGTSPRIRLAQRVLPPAQTGRTFSVGLAATGGRAPYAWTSGVIAVPAGLRLDTDGYLWGKPTVAGTYAFDAVVTDANGVSVRLPIRVSVAAGSPPPAPEPLSITDGIATVRPLESMLAFRNPLGGMRPYVGPARTHPFASLGRQYVEWNLIENRESDTVEKIRDVTDRLFGDLPSLNIKAVPRVYLIWPDPLAKYWPADLTPDDYTSDAFRARMKRLIARLGEAWNRDPRIAFVETGIIGHWGEQHDPAFASSGIRPSLPAVMEAEFGDAFRAAFPDKLLMNRYPRNLVDYPFGIHWDVFGSFDRGFWGNDTTAMIGELERPGLIGKWKIAPRGGEIAPTFLGEPDFSVESLKNVVRKYTPRLIDIIRRLHWNHLDVLPSLDPSDADVWGKASQIQNALGYRFVIREASYSAVLRPGQALSLTLKVDNIGSSPLYYAWPLEVTLLDAASRRPVWRTTWANLDVRQWLPGEPVELQQSYTLPANLPAGPYVVAVSILDPAGMVPAVRFANVNYWAGGRTPLGPVSISGPAPTSQVNEFDDLQADRSLYYVP